MSAATWGSIIINTVTRFPIGVRSPRLDVLFFPAIHILPAAHPFVRPYGVVALFQRTDEPYYKRSYPIVINE